MKNKILTTFGIGALSLPQILNADVNIDGKISELKQKGFDVKVEEIKQKVYSHDELESKRIEENTRIISEILRLYNIEKAYEQSTRDNTYLKDEINRKNAAIDRANEARKLENTRLTKEYEDKVREINRRNKESNIKISEENKIITNGNTNVNKDYSKELKRIADDKAERIQDAKEQADLIGKTNTKIKEEQAERERLVREENARRQAEYDKEVARINAENEKIKARNKEKEDKYNKQLAEYNAKLKETAAMPVVGESNGLKLVGAPREDLKGSAKYYSGYKVFSDRTDIEMVDGVLGVSPDSKVTDLNGGIRFKENDINGVKMNSVQNKYEWRYVLENVAKNSTFTITNVGKTKSGKNINLKYTILEDYVNDSERKKIKNLPAYMILYGGLRNTMEDKSRSFIGMSILNGESIRTKIDFIDDKGEAINLGVASINSDVDWAQGFGLKFNGENSSTVNANPSSSNLELLNLNGVNAYVDKEIKGAEGEVSIPNKSFLTVGSGSSVNVNFYDSSNFYKNTFMDFRTLEKTGYPDDYANTIEFAGNHNSFEWKDRGAYFSMFGPSGNNIDFVIKPVKPVLEKLDETKPVLNLISSTPGRPNINPNGPSDIPEGVDKPREETLKTGKELPLPAKPNLLPMLDKVTVAPSAPVLAKKSITVKKFIYEYVNTSSGNTIILRDMKKNTLIYSSSTSLKLRNLK